MAWNQDLAGKRLNKKEGLKNKARQYRKAYN